MFEVTTAILKKIKKSLPLFKIFFCWQGVTQEAQKFRQPKTKNSLFELLQKSPRYSIALDETCDSVDSEQMLIFVRFSEIENNV